MFIPQMLTSEIFAIRFMSLGLLTGNNVVFIHLDMCPSKMFALDQLFRLVLIIICDTVEMNTTLVLKLKHLMVSI